MIDYTEFNKNIEEKVENSKTLVEINSTVLKTITDKILATSELIKDIENCNDDAQKIERYRAATIGYANINKDYQEFIDNYKDFVDTTTYIIESLQNHEKLLQEKSKIQSEAIDIATKIM